MPKSEGDAFMGEYFGFTEGIKKSGHYLGGNALQPVQTATTVRVRNGKVSTTDGPFAETQEQLGGYYLIEAKDLNDAIQVARGRARRRAAARLPRHPDAGGDGADRPAVARVRGRRGGRTRRRRAGGPARPDLAIRPAGCCGCAG